MGGVKEWWLLTSPITLTWSVIVDDGLFEDNIMTITITGESACSTATWSSYPVFAYETYPDEPELVWSVPSALDSVSTLKLVNDYCGPYVASVQQTESGSTNAGPLTRGMFQSDD